MSENKINEIEEMTNEQMEEINKILNTPVIDATMALNIVINAVQLCYDNDEIFNQLDKALISKALECFQNKVKEGEDFFIKVVQD